MKSTTTFWCGAFTVCLPVVGLKICNLADDIRGARDLAAKMPGQVKPLRAKRGKCKCPSSHPGFQAHAHKLITA